MDHTGHGSHDQNRGEPDQETTQQEEGQISALEGQVYKEEIKEDTNVLFDVSIFSLCTVCALVLLSLINVYRAQ